MGKYKYTNDEEDLLKTIKLNQDLALELLNDSEMQSTRTKADEAIESSMQLLKELGINDFKDTRKARDEKIVLTNRSFEDIVDEANLKYNYVCIDDVLSPQEIKYALDDLNHIEQEFSRKTSIANKTDLAFLAIAIALQVTKAQITPLIANKLGYGESFDPNKRLPHNDKTIEREHRQANDKFRDKYCERYKKGYWVNMLYQTVPYDAIKGSAGIGLGLSGNNHRLKTLGHDPVLGWIFGTANILTDVVTLSNFSSYKIQRKPNLAITPQEVPIPMVFSDCVEMVKNDKMNLPAALFSQAQHLKSDVYTKRGLPVPILSVIDENFASKLYNEHYDNLCFARDTAIIGGSAAISVLINMIISLVHGLFYNGDMNRDLYEVRTRKILLISNSITSTSSIIRTAITKNPKDLDIGGILVTISRLFSDVRFIAKVKQEYIQYELDKQLYEEINKLDNIIADLT